MSFDALLIHTVTVRRMVPTTDARYNNDDLVYDPDLDVTTPARVDPIMGEERLTNRELQRERFDVYLPPDVVVAGTDELHWQDADLILKIEGPPLTAIDGIGTHHLELSAYHSTG